MLHTIQFWTYRAQVVIENQEPCGHLLQNLEVIIDELLKLKKSGNQIDLPEDFLETTQNFFGYAEEKGLNIYSIAFRLNAFQNTSSSRTSISVQVDKQGRMFEAATGKRIFSVDPKKILKSRNQIQNGQF